MRNQLQPNKSKSLRGSLDFGAAHSFFNVPTKSKNGEGWRVGISKAVLEPPARLAIHETADLAGREHLG
jgi:hypothetical protein